jgi:hypothetical protein
VKTKCLNARNSLVVGWTDPEGSRPHLGALLLAYYTSEGKLIYAGPRRYRHLSRVHWLQPSSWPK